MLRKIILSGLLLLGLTSSVQSKNLIPDDKFKHMFVGAGIYVTCIFGGGALDIIGLNGTKWFNKDTCLIPVFLAGAGKELYDYKHPKTHTAEFADFAYTMSLPLITRFIILEF